MQKNNSKSAPRRWSWGTFFLTIPYVIWMAVFILIPLGVVMFYALTDPATGLFSLDNLSKIFTGAFPRIFLRSVWYSLVASLICLVIGYPVAYFIARQRPGVQRFLYLLVMLPMCMSFLLRTLAWVGLLRHHQPVPGAVRHRPPAPHPHHRRSDSGHGVQLPALYDPAPLHRHHEDRPPAH